MLKLLLSLLLGLSLYFRGPLVRQRKNDLRIAAFNIRGFGERTMNQTPVVNAIKKIIRRYDLVFIQEIRDKANTSIFELLHTVNHRLWRGRKYRLALSPRLGRTTYKEAYAYMYRENKLNVATYYVYDDGPETKARIDPFEREPFVILFSSSAIGLQKFFIIGCHIQPSKAPEELKSLMKVYESTVQRLNTTDGLIMGDFNADCGYFSNRDLESHNMKTDKRFLWLIDDDQDTTVAQTDCAYDRIIATGRKMKDSVVKASAKVFNFTEEYDLTMNETESISDHYPVELKLT